MSENLEEIKELNGQMEELFASAIIIFNKLAFLREKQKLPQENQIDNLKSILTRFFETYRLLGAKDNELKQKADLLSEKYVQFNIEFE
ncbi:hypothetical protein C4569_03850 [Candidatus Parcubacteria bacterium]|nr:MAG: hypothetical protein C4569_03850 [Candidatus Parcubacteria bacterium]